MNERREVPVSVSLAAVKAGDEVQIQEILFGSLREHCRALDMSIGDRVRCRVAGRAALLLVTPNGRSVSLDVDRARFIKVSP